MKQRPLTFFFMMLASFLCVMPPSFLCAEEPVKSEPLTIPGCFEAAMKHYETVPIQEAEIEAAEGRYLQALGSALPHLTVKGSEFLQDTSGTSTGGSEFASSFIRRSRPEVAVNLKQPLFQGLREFRTISGASADRQKNILETRRAEDLLYVEVARAFLTVKQLEEDLKIVESEWNTAHHRVDELRGRVGLGKSRASEVLATEGELAQVEADREEARGKLSIAREMLAFLTGVSPEATLAELQEQKADLAPLPTYLPRAGERSDVRAAEETAKLSEAKLEYYKGGRLPQLNLEGNYYPYRVGFQKEIDWDLMLTLDVPIFRGGQTRGEIREARARAKQAELGKSESRRRAELEIANTYHDLTASRDREEALTRATAKLEATYRSLLKEYRLGLVNNLDVLQAAREWHGAKRSANQARHQRHLNEILFKSATGDLR